MTVFFNEVCLSCPFKNSLHFQAWWWMYLSRSFLGPNSSSRRFRAHSSLNSDICWRCGAGQQRNKGADRAGRSASVCLYPQFALFSWIPAGVWTSDPRMRPGNKGWWERFGGMVNGTIKDSELMKWFVKLLHPEARVQDQLCRSISYITRHCRIL